MDQEVKPSFWSKLPSFVWIILFVLGIAALIGGMIGLFWGMSSIEGFASILLLVIAWIVLRAGSSDEPPVPTHPQAAQGQQFVIALGIGFFALMGMAIDQPGNAIYNQPLEWLFCPANSHMERGIVVTNPKPGTTNISQDFSCYATEDGTPTLVKQIPVLGLMGFRFVEYVLLGYLLMAINRVYTGWRRRRWLAQTVT